MTMSSSTMGKYSQTRSRTSSPHPSLSTTSRRPKLVRASATAPSVATSNASRKDLSNQQSPRAASILSRVASYSTSQQTSPSSSCSSPGPRSLSEERRKESFSSMSCHQSGSYFSFPSFEDFQEYQEADATRSSKG
ncbi:hypothetical protein PVAG01_02422 [Phlyctema vagabunda]|uniref:Uncharacterized protein n=1 Tax=Phlyctema vagabunda TaxID=108571 RepID=A0ABR4PRU7_9HELO